MDAATRAAVQQMASELARLRNEVNTLKRGGRGGQLANSSLEEGQAVEVRDENGAVRLRFGYQPDGRAAVVTEGGDPVTAPTAPTVTPMPSGLRVSWDGALADDSVLPSDFDHVNVHVSTEDGFTPSEATFVVTIPRSAGAVPIAPLTVGTTYYVVLVPVTTGGIVGDPSAQASGVPAAVTDIAPGSITETEIADDAISTPKLRAEAVTALKIAAEAIEAGHIQAAAVTAAKLEAELVLGTRIIAGTPSGARVELDSNGIRGYNAADELVFVVDDTGTALFSGDIVASEITGSRMVVGEAPGGVVEIDSIGAVARVRATANNNARSQLQATGTQAEFSSFSDASSSTTMAGGFGATPDRVFFVLNSDNSSTTVPLVQASAQPGHAVLQVASAPADTTKPHSYLGATDTQAYQYWRSGPDVQANLTVTSSSVTQRWQSNSDNGITISAFPTTTQMSFTMPAPAVGSHPASGGLLYGLRSSAGDQPQLSLQSPYATSGPSAGRRAFVVVTGGATASHPTARVFLNGNEVLVSNDYDQVAGAYTTDDGQLRLTSTHSINATRMRPVIGRQLATPTATTSGSFVDFSAGQWERPELRSPASGVLRVDITAAVNSPHATASMSIGFRIIDTATSGSLYTQTVREKVWYAGGLNNLTRAHTATHFVEVTPNRPIRVIPTWWKTSQDWTSSWSFWADHGTHIAVTPQP